MDEHANPETFVSILRRSSDAAAGAAAAAGDTSPKRTRGRTEAATSPGHGALARVAEGSEGSSRRSGARLARTLSRGLTCTLKHIADGTTREGGVGMANGITPAAEAEASTSGLARLECVVLNGCKTEEIGRHLLGLAHGVMVVCWSTLAEDNAARVFSQVKTRVAHTVRSSDADSIHATALQLCLLLSLSQPSSDRLQGFYESVNKQRAALVQYAEQRPSFWSSWRKRRLPPPFSVEVAFRAGCECFMQHGFKFGDPEAYLHPPGHPHNYRPEFATCEGCTPPVHGNVMLLRRSADGEVDVVSETSARPALSRGNGNARLRLTSLLGDDFGTIALRRSSRATATSRLTSRVTTTSRLTSRATNAARLTSRVTAASRLTSRATNAGARPGSFVARVRE